MELFLEPLRDAATQIDRIINAFIALAVNILTPGMDTSFLPNIIKLIVNNEYLLIGLSLVIIGFVIGIIKRIISI